MQSLVLSRKPLRLALPLAAELATQGLNVAHKHLKLVTAHIATRLRLLRQPLIKQAQHPVTRFADVAELIVAARYAPQLRVPSRRQEVE